eukprot:6476764-Amphidinium_carterae.3
MQDDVAKPEAFALPPSGVGRDASRPRPRSAPPPKSSLSWATRTIGAAERHESADARPGARPEVVHISGFTEPRSHNEFKQWAELNLPMLSANTLARTRGEYNVRMSLQFACADAVRDFVTNFRAKLVRESPGGQQLYVQRDLTHDQRKVGYVLRGVRKHLVSHSQAWHKGPSDSDDGPLTHIKIGYSSSAVYLNKWRVAYVSTRGGAQLHFDKKWPSGVTKAGLAAALGCEPTMQ